MNGRTIALLVILYFGLRLIASAPSTHAALPEKTVDYKGDGKFEIKSLDKWMEVAPEILNACLNEGVHEPEELVNNLFRRLFPKQMWPPQKGDPRYGVWLSMVEATGRRLERPYKPGLRIVEGA